MLPVAIITAVTRIVVIQPPEHLKAFILKELRNEIKMLHPRRAPGIELITAQMLKELPHEGLLHLMYIFNSILRRDYWPTSLKRAQIIMIPKPGKAGPSCRAV
jgi:hypothetical protein